MGESDRCDKLPENLLDPIDLGERSVDARGASAAGHALDGEHDLPFACSGASPERPSRPGGTMHLWWGDRGRLVAMLRPDGMDRSFTRRFLAVSALRGESRASR